jgi:hypothetical protein
MPDMSSEIITEVLQAFARVFEASAGPEGYGTWYVGRESVRASFAAVWATFPDAHWGNARHFVCGDRECRSGRSQEHGQTALASKFMVVTCSPFETARLHWKILTARTVRLLAPRSVEMGDQSLRKRRVIIQISSLPQPVTAYAVRFVFLFPSRTLSLQ